MTKNMLAQAIAEKLFPIKWRNPVKQDRTRKV